MIVGALLDDNEMGRMAALIFAPLFLTGAGWWRGRYALREARPDAGHGSAPRTKEKSAWRADLR
jgi:hypothetical protein